MQTRTKQIGAALGVAGVLAVGIIVTMGQHVPPTGSGLPVGCRAGDQPEWNGVIWTCESQGTPASPAWGPGGRYYWAPNTTATATTNAWTTDQLRAMPFYYPGGAALAAMGTHVTVAGQAGGKVRLGIYRDEDGRPGALLVDAGQIAADSATGQELAINLTLKPDWYWLAAVTQDITTTQPTMASYQNFMPVVDCGTTMPSAQQACGGFLRTGVSGALPDPFGGVPTTMLSHPRIFFKTQ